MLFRSWQQQVWDVSVDNGSQPMGAYSGIIAWRVVYIGKNYTGILTSEYNTSLASDATVGPYYHRAAVPGTENGLTVGSLILTSTGLSPSNWSTLWKTQKVTWKNGGDAGRSPTSGYGYNWIPISWNIGPTPWICGLPVAYDPLTAGGPPAYTTVI